MPKGPKSVKEATLTRLAYASLTRTLSLALPLSLSLSQSYVFAFHLIEIRFFICILNYFEIANKTE